MSHYCCKRCGQRYERCTCRFDEAKASTDSTPAKKPASKRKNGLPSKEALKKFFRDCPAIRIEIFSQNRMSWNTTGTRPSEHPHYYRVVAQNGNTLLTSESYAGGARKALRAARNFIVAAGIPRMEVRILREDKHPRFLVITPTSEEELML